jgi:xylulokinase
MSLLAVDIGSSSCKAVAFTTAGGMLAQHSSAYSPEFPKPSHVELDPRRFWDAVCACTRAVAHNLAEPVQALCLSSHGETFIPVNKDNKPIGPAILNQDSRAHAESTWLEQKLGRTRLFEITGLVAHSMYPIPKILWLRKYQPEMFSPAIRFVSVIGCILLHLGFPPYVDDSLASRYLAFNVRKRRWSEEILQATDLKSACLPETVAAGTVVGKLDSVRAGQLGLPSGVQVVLGGHDQPCGALGVGVITPGGVADSLGTYECVLAASDAPILTDAALAASLNSYCHVVPGKFVTIAYFPSGIMVQWFHDLLYRNESEPGSCDKRLDAEYYAFLEAQAPSGPSGLCITPNLIGTCNPDFNPHARGIIFGLDRSTGRAHIYKGILEGLACELSQLTRLLASAVGDFPDIYATGGGTRSLLGLKLRAALTGKSLHLMRCPEAVCLGSAILAAVAIGEYRNIPEAVRQMVHEANVVAPDPAMAASYARQMQQYQRIRSSLAAIPGASG